MLSAATTLARECPQTTPPSAPSTSTWTLRQGMPVGKELSEWAQKAGWNVVWNLPKDYVVPAQKIYSGDFKAVTSEVINTLAENGLVIRVKFYDGNKTAVISGAGLPQQ